MAGLGSSIRHGGALAEAMRLYGGVRTDWLDLSTGINPDPIEIPALEPASWRRLPDTDDIEAAADAAAMRYGLPADARAMPVPGTQAAIRLLPGLMEPACVAIIGPTYGEYARCFAAAGWIVETVASLDDICERHVMAVIVNPDNPTARIAPRDALIAAAHRLAARGGLLVVDEAFADVWLETSVAAQAASHPGLVVLRSFGKFFGLAGLRLGFVVTTGDVRNRMEAMLGPWPVSGPALAIAAKVLKDERLVRAVASGIAVRSAATRRVLTDCGLSIIGDGGLFFLVESRQADEIHRRLCERFILTRPFDHREHWLRFGLASDAEAESRLARALRACPIGSRG